MAEYYTKPEADARFASNDHTHNLEDLGGAELPANRIEVPAGVSAAFDDAFTLDEALESIADQLGNAGAPDLTGYATTEAMNAALAGKANTNHHHAQYEIDGLSDALAAKADLVGGKVPDYQLPSYVDDVIEGTLSNSITFRDTLGVKLPAETGKIYVDTNTNKIYRWSGSVFVELSGAQAAQAITAHLEDVAYSAPVGGTWTNIPLTNWVSTGNELTVVDNQIRIGAGISKVLISAQICVGSASPAGNKYMAIRKNASQNKARTQIRLHEAYTPETFCIPSLLVDVAEGDLLTIDYSGTQGDSIYGELLFTYLTVQKIA